MRELAVAVVHRFCIALFSALEQTTLMWHVFLNESLAALHTAFLNIHRSGLLAALFGCYAAGATRNCCRLGAFCVHVPCNHAPRHVTSLRRTQRISRVLCLDKMRD